MSVNPYDPPKDATDPLRDTFRTKFWPVYLVATPLTWFGSVATSTALGMELTREMLQLSMVLAVVVCLVMTAFLTLFFTVNVSENGLRCFDFFGRYHTIPWHAITHGRPVNLFGLRYLRLYATGHATVWLPLYLKRMTEFWDVVGRWAPAAVKNRDAWQA